MRKHNTSSLSTECFPDFLASLSALAFPKQEDDLGLKKLDQIRRSRRCAWENRIEDVVQSEAIDVRLPFSHSIADSLNRDSRCAGPTLRQVRCGRVVREAAI